MKVFGKSPLFCAISVSSLIGTSNLFTHNLYALSSGPPAYGSGAPIANPKEGTCNANGCHNSFTTNTGTAQFSITGPAVYIPGKSVQLTVSFTAFTGKVHGFEMTAVDANGKRIGTFKKNIITDKTTQIIPPNSADIYKRGLKTVDKGKYIEQTSKGTKSSSWKVRWKAPLTATGPITFYAAGIDGNGNGAETGDHVYTAAKQLTQ